MSASKSLHLLLLVLMTSTISVTTGAATVASPDSSKLTEIWLSEYLVVDAASSVVLEDFRFNEQFSNDVIRRNGSDYVISNNVLEVAMACQSEFPVKWSFPHEEQISGIESRIIQIEDYRKSTMNLSGGPPRNVGYTTFLIFRTLGLRFLSVTLSCIGVNDTHHQDSGTHLYFQKQHTIENQGSTIDVGFKNESLQQDIVVPCRPAQPDATVSLFTQQTGNKSTSWAPYSPPKYRFLWQRTPEDETLVSFNPKLGFTFHNVYIPAEGQLLKCVIDGGDQDKEFTLVNMTEKFKPKDNFVLKPRLEVKGRASIEVREPSLNQLGNEMEIKCCSGNTSAPAELYGFECESAQLCDLIKRTIQWRNRIPLLVNITDLPISLQLLLGLAKKGAPVNSSITNTSCATKRFFGTSVVVTCHGENIDFAQEYIGLYNQSALDVNLENLETLVPFVFVPKSSLTSTPNLQRAWMSMGTPLDHLFDNHLLGVKTRKTDIFRGRTELSAKLRPFSLQPVLDVFTSILKKKFRILELRVLHESERFHVMCFGLQYFYSVGGRMRLNMKNKTNSVEVEGPFEELTTYSEKKTSFWPTDQLSFVISKEWEATLEMDSVDCYMPVKNSDQWDKVSWKLNVLPSLPPKFGGELEETVYLGPNETDHKVECRLTQGTPSPRFIVTTDGMPVNMQILNSKVTIIGNLGNGLSGAIISLSATTLEFHSVYQCIAANIAGHAVRTIRVIIKDSPNSDGFVEVICIISLVLGVVLLLLVGVFLYRRGQPRSSLQAARS